METQGKLHIYMGEGKGKTTAAVGQAVRFAGHEGKVAFVQFMKDSSSGELTSFEDLDNITVMPNPGFYGFTWEISEQGKEEVRQVYEQYMDSLLFRVLQSDFGMLVMDEIVTAVEKGFIAQETLMDFLDQLPDNMEIVLTGRYPAQELIDRADYITEMK
jgi:cob(I)alamin adenosyltransferase